jgi:hypothetical protein
LDLCSLRDLPNPPAPAADRLLCWLPAFIFILRLLPCLLACATEAGKQQWQNRQACCDMYVCRGLLQSFPWPLSYIASYRLNCLSRRRSQSCRTGVSTLLVSCIIAGLEERSVMGITGNPRLHAAAPSDMAVKTWACLYLALYFTLLQLSMASMIRFLLSAACPHLSINPHDHACVVMCAVRLHLVAALSFLHSIPTRIRLLCS